MRTIIHIDFEDQYQLQIRYHDALLYKEGYSQCGTRHGEKIYIRTRIFLFLLPSFQCVVAFLVLFFLTKIKAEGVNLNL